MEQQHRRSLAELAQQFVEAHNWSDSYAMLRRHPELLSDEVDTMFVHLIALASAQGNEEAGRMLMDHRQLLRRCRGIGIEAAFREKMEMIRREQERQQGSQPEQATPALHLPADIESALHQAFMAGEAYESTLDLTFLERAIAAWQYILRHSSFERTSRQFQLAVLPNAAQALVRQFQQTGDLDDLDQGTQLLQRALQYTDINPTTRPIILNGLGDTLNMRYTSARRLQDLEKAIASYREAAAHTASDDSALAVYLNNLGVALRDHYKHTGKPESLEQAIQANRHALSLLQTDSPSFSQYCTELGMALLDLYHQQGQIDDLQQAIASFQQAVNYATSDSSRLTGYLTNLGIGLNDRFNHLGKIQDLEESIRLHREAVRLALPDASGRLYYLTNLASALGDYYDQTGTLETLEESIKLLETVLQQTPRTSPDFPDYLVNLAVSLHKRYERLAHLQDVQGIITLYREAMELTPEDSPLWPDTANKLGNALRDSYDHQEQTTDLEEAIRLHTLALARTPVETPSRPVYLSSLAGDLSTQYAHTGQLESLREAINQQREAVALAPADSPTQQVVLGYNLGLLLLHLYDRTEQQKDIEEAIRLFEYCAGNLASASPSLPRAYNSLGNALRRLYHRTRRQADLRKAIEVLQTSSQLRPPDSPELAGAYNDLGNALRDLYTSTRALQDLEEAIDAFRKAQQVDRQYMTINRPVFLSDLGNVLRDRYLLLAQKQDLQEARNVYEQACQEGLRLTPEVALGTARFWGNWASERGEWAEAAHAYTYAVQALETLYRVQLLQANREEWQRETSGIYARAAYTMARAGLLQEAVTTLEQGRAKRLSAALARDQADFQEIQKQDLEAYQLYQDAAARLRLLERTERTGGFSSLEQQAQGFREASSFHEQVKQAQTALEQAILRIRGLSGHENFLASSTFQDILKTARPGMPVVYLATTSWGSCSFLVYAGNDVPELILIDGFTESHLQRLLVKPDTNGLPSGYLPGQLSGSNLQMFKRALKELLPFLGTHLIGPIAHRLSQQGASGVILIPADLLGVLPLHSAPYLSHGKETCLLDEFDVACVPSARVLAIAQRKLPARHQAATTMHFVGIGNPFPSSSNAESAQQPGQISSNLAYARMEVEHIQQLLPPSSSSITLYEEQATAEAVWQALSQATTAHFACHGKFEIREPMDSALLLADNTRLALCDLLNTEPEKLARIQMTVLSACQTALTDFQHLPDEVIGLHAGFLQAGIPSVIGTLWSVNDLSTALLMTRFYELYLWGDAQTDLPPQSPARALRLAQCWLRELTDSGAQAYAHQPQRHIRVVMQDSERGSGEFPYASPYYWAPFVYYGAL